MAQEGQPPLGRISHGAWFPRRQVRLHPERETMIYRKRVGKKWLHLTDVKTGKLQSLTRGNMGREEKR